MELASAIARCSLVLSESAVREAQAALWSVLDEARKASIPATPKALDRLYTYAVPRLSPDGTCSLPGDLAETPYDLGEVLGGRVMHNTLSLMVVAGFLERVVAETKLDWVGVYQLRDRRAGPTLVKLGSRGKPSRAEFPVTADFEKRSTNVTVARSGKAVVIADTEAHRAAGGAYYECDAAVRSEACVPVYSRAGEVIGIVDAEHHSTNAFDERRLAFVAALAFELPQHLPLR